MFQPLDERTCYLTEVRLATDHDIKCGSRKHNLSPFLDVQLSSVFWNTRDKPQLACCSNVIKIYGCVFSQTSRLKQLADLESGQNFLQAGKSRVLFVCFSLSAFILALHHFQVPLCIFNKNTHYSGSHCKIKALLFLLISSQALLLFLKFGIF